MMTEIKKAEEMIKTIAENAGMTVTVNTAIETETVQIKKINGAIEQKYFDLWKAKKAIEKEMEALKNQITVELEEENAQGEKIQCVWVEPSYIFDSALFKSYQPDMYAMYQKKKSGYFTIKVDDKG